MVYILRCAVENGSCVRPWWLAWYPWILHVVRVDDDDDVISRHLQTPKYGRERKHCKAKQIWYLVRSNKQKKPYPLSFSPILDADYPNHIRPKQD
jgi:hypothetical protein